MIGDLENVLALKRRLLDSLGEKGPAYLSLLRRWFGMKIKKEEFEFELKTQKILSRYQTFLHKQFILCLLSEGITEPKNPPVSFPKEFEPIHPSNYVVTRKQELEIDTPYTMAQEGYLPDHNLMLARLRYGAWEFGLEGSSSNAAHLLLVATQLFLKNILTAIITRRKGYKLDRNWFIRGIGSDIPNPWLRNIRNRKQTHFHCLTINESVENIDENLENILIPNPRRTLEEIERQKLYNLASSDPPYIPKMDPISITDLLIVLQLFPSLIPSHYVKTINMQRIFSRLRHPAPD